jgi:hypothetical protein
MNKLLLSTISVFLFHFVNSQTSTFYGNFTPTTSYLVPANEEEVTPKNIVIKPNFKGRDLIQVDQSPSHNIDWVWQQHENLQKTTSATVLWQGTGLGQNLSPPDPTVDADSTVTIQSTNSGGGAVYRIFNKSTGAIISSSLTMQALGGPSGLGDPIVLYYKPSKRWFLMEFSSTGNKLLLHVSQTSNPQGAYFTYQFTCPSFPDYPKWSFCPTSDAFLVSTNEGGPPTIYAMKLSSLLAGTASPFIGVDIGYSLNGFGFQSITPVDIEGDIAAPANMKPLFVRHRDDESHTNGSPDSPTNDWIELWEMTINWTASTATVAKTQDISIAEIDSKLCGLTSFTCIPQPGTTVDLDPLRETVMFKAPMRIFDTHQSMVLCLSTDVNGADRSGVRWIEIRRATGSLGAWSLYQEGTYAPGTTTNRWMPAINIDKYGNIIMAYSTSSNTAGDFPSLKMTGRKPCDPLGQMTMTETTIIAGTGSKTGNTRWGDYHHMSIDDFDGQTFYFTGVYYSAATKSSVSAIRMNPEASDAMIVAVYPVNVAAICGSTAQVGVVIENRGTNPITTGSFSWQVGAGAVTNVNYSSNQLTSVGAKDTIFITVSGLVAGPNTITATSISVNASTPDENTCNDTKVATITAGTSTLLVTSVVNTAPSCTVNNGQITISVSGGVSPYVYSINGGVNQGNGVFSSLAPGLITYSVTDNVGCAGTGSIQLSTITQIAVASNQISNVLCNGQQNASIQLTASGGQSAYTYSQNGITYVASGTFTNLAAGTYVFYAKDAAGCIGSTTITINQPSALVATASPTTVSCFGMNDGMVTALASGGTAPYTYSIDGTNFSSNTQFTGLAPGPYTVTVQDANGCQSTYTTTVVEPSALSVVGVSTPASWNNGTITLTGSGGLAPYTYSINGTNYYSGSLFSMLFSGTYTCYIQDNNGCISTTTIVIEAIQGIEENNNSSLQVNLLYPNPNNGTFELQIDGIIGDEVNCKLFNMQGQLVNEFKLGVQNGSAKNTIEMSKKLAAGSYFLGIYNNNKACVVKFIKE